MSIHEEQTRSRYQSAEYAANYKEEYTSGWSFKAIRSRIIAAREISTIDFLLGSKNRQGTSMLDIPCGTGKLGELLSRTGASIVAADVSQEMIDLARQEYTGSDVTFAVQDATALDVEAGRFDTIVCLRLFQRLERATRRQILDEFARTCTGELVISYASTSMLQRVRAFVRRSYDVERNVFFGVERKAIEEELLAAGFVVVEQRSVLPGLSQEVISLARRI